MASMIRLSYHHHSLSSSSSSSASSLFTTFSPEFNFKSWKNKNSNKASSFPLHFPLSSSSFPFSRIRISASFRPHRPSSSSNRRQNYLRKKLTQQQQQQQQVSSDTSIIHNSVDKFVDNDGFITEKRWNLDEGNGNGGGVGPSSDLESKSNGYLSFDKLDEWFKEHRRNLDGFSEETSNFESNYSGVGSLASGTAKTNYESNSELFDKLERWVEEQYKNFDSFGEENKNVDGTHDLNDEKESIQNAKSLSIEMKQDENDVLVPQNSPVVKFVTSVGKSGLLDVIQGVNVKSVLRSSILSRFGMMTAFCIIVVLAVKKLFSTDYGQSKQQEYTSLEKEMMRRKLKARTERERKIKGSVEVIQDSVCTASISVERPQLDRKELTNSILKAGESPISSQGAIPVDHHRFLEIQVMARQARKLENRDSSGENVHAEWNQKHGFIAEVPQMDNQVGCEELKKDCIDESKIENGIVVDEASTKIGWTGSSNLEMKNQDDNIEGLEMDVEDIKVDVNGTDSVELVGQGEAFRKQNHYAVPNGSSVRKKFKVIGSVKEAREYISKNRTNEESIVLNAVITADRDKKSTDVGPGWELKSTDEPALDPDSLYVSENSSSNVEECSSTICIHPKSNAIEVEEKGDPTESAVMKLSKEEKTNFGMSKDLTESKGAIDLQEDRIDQASSPGNRKNWMEKNFHEFKPIVKKIGAGFRDNYTVARTKTKQDMNLQTDLSQLMPDKNDDELEWMKDARLREIVFKVRDNEIAGKDPFYQMAEQDKLAFFAGLEKKVEQENYKLSNLHNWVHLNIENLDYGADGISLYDPPEKVVPRWKGPPVEKIPEFLKSCTSQPDLTGQSSDNSSGSIQNLSLKEPRIAIERSDGSIRAGKKSGKEYWQHTKKWSQGFLESYNAESDPEIKSVMKDMGKDLDRWITEKEIKEAAELMDKLPERGRQLIKEKLDRVKREMELFGPQAVASKYREYADEKEKDYLWWLDLPYVLCIELYTEEQGEQKVGFYSLEMAADLELEPKPYHVIAFEDAVDCKNMCYIIQAHLEMLGKGLAFVVARPPKDAFREAKANGFSVTVIRRGELQLNVDQTLEEVEEVITEMGSKIFHNAIMKERSLDFNAVMKGVFGLKKPMRRRRSKRALKKRANS